MSDEMKLNNDTTVEQEATEPELSNEDLDVSDKRIPPEPTPLEKVQAETIAYKDQLVRLMAEFENYKKRTQKEFSQLIRQANEKLIVEFLPVLDDMERTLKAAPEPESANQKVQSFTQAVDLIYQKMILILGKQGLKPVESAGNEFNVDLHDALMQVDAPDKESNTVIEEYEKGYWLNDKVIRHAKVIVAK
jgi:molecular chaperone GrpE